MQNMVVLIDTNILLNYLTNREADYIITCNTKDFANSEVPAVNPKEFLKLI